jgi:hypothetical protein
MPVRGVFYLAMASACLASALAGASHAATDQWIELSKDLSAFHQPTGTWFIAGDAKVDPQNERRLTGEPGSGVLINGKSGRTRNLITNQSWGDVQVQLEFLIPNHSNSGVKLEGVYEIQIYDSWHATKLTGADCGGIYPRAESGPYRHIDEGTPPLVNACKAPGEWQSLDITFRAPRFDKSGKKVANAQFEKVLFNGKLIHNNAEVAHPTGAIWRNPEEPTGPLLFQADHGPVAFRNIRVRPLEPQPGN